MPPQEGQREVTLDSLQVAYILDTNKGTVSAYVGPQLITLQQTMQPVKYIPSKGFVRCNLEDSIQLMVQADEDEYVVLTNPSAQEEREHPQPSSTVAMVDLQTGRKINIPGPVQFALWPGQVAEVVPGHMLRSDQYLLAAVYNEDAANASIGEMRMRPQASKGESGSGEGSVERSEEPSAPDAAQQLTSKQLTMGQRIVIKGTEVSFFIPSTGIEVVRDDRTGEYVRGAVTLERLQYCILRDENGEKRYVIGPDVVFPEPTESFVPDDAGKVVFQAIELNDDMGLHIKVIADYTDEDGTEHKVGEELFVTGKEQRIYYPRAEHALVRYGEQYINYAVAIPAGEARYVLDKIKGSVGTEKGPRMFLADPRTQVIVRRVLDPNLVKLWYPGNVRAIEVNQYMADIAARSAPEELEALAGDVSYRAFAAAERPLAESLVRKTKFTPPRTLTLDTKYDGAVVVGIWTGYAVKVVSKTGNTRVEVGPKAVILEYDETLEAFDLSTGTPKSKDRTIRDVYLRVKNNKVSDVVEAETSDLVNVAVRLSYRVNFEGEPSEWFNVDDYVGFLCEHLRSIVRGVIKTHGIEEFNKRATEIIRDAILGEKKEGGRDGKNFPENGMRVYDVDVLDVTIGDTAIADMLAKAKHNAVAAVITLEERRRVLEATRETEDINRQIATEQAKTAEQTDQLAVQAINRELEAALALVRKETDQREAQLVAQRDEQELLGEIAQAQLAREKAGADQRLAIATAQAELEIKSLQAGVDAFKKQAEAISDKLADAINFFGQTDLAGRLAEHLGPLAVLRGDSIVDTIRTFMIGLSPQLKEVLDRFMPQASE